tara:strand:+ start:177 stop:437 length:261 start_codon:yes stop_codon:yes gene_type:complete
LRIVASIEEQLFHFFKFIELSVSQAWWAVSVVAINAEIAVLVSSNDSFASSTLAGCALSVLNNHLAVLAAKEFFHENSHLILLDGS